MADPCRVVVLISGNGSNLQALIDAATDHNYQIVAVLSNKADAYGLERAKNAGIAQEHLSHKAFDTREDFDRALQQRIDRYQPELIVLAGFMRILSAGFVRHYLGRLINIHPSLLPKYPGLHTHQRALDAGDSEAGATVHFVTEELDGGPPIIQAKVPISGNDSADDVAKRVLLQEYRIYPQALAWFASGRLRLNENEALLDDKVLPPGGMDWTDRH